MKVITVENCARGQTTVSNTPRPAGAAAANPLVAAREHWHLTYESANRAEAMAAE
jgi:hypothetical protein